MGEQDGLLLRILRGTSDANIPFDGLCQMLQRLGFTERIRGSHHIFTKWRMLSLRHSIGARPPLETLARGAKRVSRFRCYASPPPTEMCARLSPAITKPNV